MRPTTWGLDGDHKLLVPKERPPRAKKGPPDPRRTTCPQSRPNEEKVAKRVPPPFPPKEHWTEPGGSRWCESPRKAAYWRFE